MYVEIEGSLCHLSVFLVAQALADAVFAAIGRLARILADYECHKTRNEVGIHITAGILAANALGVKPMSRAVGGVTGVHYISGGWVHGIELAFAFVQAGRIWLQACRYLARRVFHLEGGAEHRHHLAVQVEFCAGMVRAGSFREIDVVFEFHVAHLPAVNFRLDINCGVGTYVRAAQLEVIRPLVVILDVVVPTVLHVCLQRRCHNEPHLLGFGGHGETDVCGLDAGAGTVDGVLGDILTGAVGLQHHIPHTESSVRSATGAVILLAAEGDEIVTVMVFCRVGVSEITQRTHGGEGGGDFCAFRLGVKRYDIESGALRTAGICHLIGAVGYHRCGISEIADKGVVEIWLAFFQVVGGHVHGEVEMQFIQFVHCQSFQVHQHLVEVFGLCLRMTPHLINGLQVAVFLAEIEEKHICLIAMPFMCKGIVVGVGEMIIGAVVCEYLVWIGIERLPLGGGLPYRGAGAYCAVEAGPHIRQCALLGGVAVTHVMETVTYLVSHGGTHWFARGRVNPQGGNGKVVATAIACPFLLMQKAYDDLVFMDVAVGVVAESELLHLILIEALQFVLQVGKVEVIEVAARQLVRTRVAPALLPIDDEVVGLHASALGILCLVVRVIFQIHTRIVPPFVWNVNGLFRKHIHRHYKQ